MSVLPQIGGGKLADQVSRLLEQQILAGDWAPGHLLPPENELAAQLAVSRTVVRDAVKTLAARGLVTVRQGLGTTVAAPSDAAYSEAIFLLLLRSDATVGEVLEARELIEVSVAGTAAARRTRDDLARLERHLDDFAAAADAVDWPRGEVAHLEFHLAILDAVRSPVLQVLLRPLQQIILTTGYGPVIEDDPERWNVKAHRDVLDAIRAQDEPGARRAMTAHFAFRGEDLYADYHATRFRDAPALQAELRKRHGSAG
jgi:GntR family transcriptional repressor for pyruvate dehydrogenase complex